MLRHILFQFTIEFQMVTSSAPLPTASASIKNQRERVAWFVSWKRKNNIKKACLFKRQAGLLDLPLSYRGRDVTGSFEKDQSAELSKAFFDGISSEHEQKARRVSVHLVSIHR